MNYYLTTFALLTSLQVSAQLWVGSEGMTILPGTALTVDGLTLTPSSTLIIANNSIQKTNTPITGNSTINRLYQLSASLVFSGRVGINYLTSELNGYSESTLQLAYTPAANTQLTVTTNSTVDAINHYLFNELTNQNLYIVTATALSDLTPILYARPTVINGKDDFNLVVDVVELNSVATNGSFTVKITKDAKLNLSFNSGATLISGRSVQNNVWSFNGADPNYYVLSTSQSIAAGDKLTFGLSGQLDPKATKGVVTISSIILPTSLTEASLANNFDADKVEYFQQ